MLRTEIGGDGDVASRCEAARRSARAKFHARRRTSGRLAVRLEPDDALARGTLGARLLARTTRSVAPTEAGEKLMASVGPRIAEIEESLAELSRLSDRPSGTIRLTAVDYAAESVLWPALADFLLRYPDVHVDLTVDNTLRDIVGDGFDAGIRICERVARDMIAVQIGPEIRMAAVASPAYFASHDKPRTPPELAQHNCINMRFATLGNVYAWEFEKGTRELNVRVEGQLTGNDIAVIKQAALSGVGIAFVPEDIAQPHIERSELVRVLADWTPPFPGYYLYYPSRHQ